MRFITSLGQICYSHVKQSDKVEYTENEKFWSQSSCPWIQIHTIRVIQKFKGNGKILLKDFISNIKSNIVLNAIPLDEDISFTQLQNWYIKQNFKQISKDNISLFLLK